MTPFKIFAFLLGIIFMFPWVDKLWNKLKNNENKVKAYNAVYIITGIVLMICLMFCIITLASDSYNPFIYFRF